MSEEGLSPLIHPGWAGPSVVALAPTAGLAQWRLMVLMLMAVRAHTQVDMHKGLTSVPTPPYLGIFS